MNSICEEIMSGNRRLFICSELDGHVQVRTPYLYPDGDFIDVYIQRIGDQTIVTDRGETIRWLGTQALSTIDVWSSEDFNLLETLSDIAYWSEPDDFADQLMAA